MQLYTGTGSGELTLEMFDRYGLGIMLSGDPTKTKNVSRYRCAIDNGAYMAYQRGLPWLESRYMEHLGKCWNAGVTADFVVAPDIVKGGMDSLRFSLSWVKRLRPANLALAVQDGMGYDIIETHNIPYDFGYVFVGGSKEWKLATLSGWVEAAHRNGMRCHGARMGKLSDLRFAQRVGCDSVDSTSWVRNNSWDILDEFLSPIAIQQEVEFEVPADQKGVSVVSENAAQ